MNRAMLAIFVFFLAIVLAGATTLAGPKGEKGPNCSDGIDNDGDGLIDGADPDCGGDSGGTTEPINFPPLLEVQWVSTGLGNTIMENQVRTCNLSSNGAGGLYASYHCPHGGSGGGPGGPIFLQLSGGEQVARKGDAALCDYLDGLEVEPNSSYQLDWDCTTSPCVVRVLNWAVGDEVAFITEGQADTIHVQAFAQAEPNWPTDFLGDFFRVDVTFKANGTNKTSAICRYESDLEGMAHDQTPTP